MTRVGPELVGGLIPPPQGTGGAGVKRCQEGGGAQLTGKYSCTSPTQFPQEQENFLVGQNKD